MVGNVFEQVANELDKLVADPGPARVNEYFSKSSAVDMEKIKQEHQVVIVIEGGVANLEKG